MTEAQKALIKKIAMIVVAVILLAYIIYQSYMVIYDPVTTEIAYEYTVEDTVDTKVFVAREESYITNSKKGTIISAVEDGSRVSKNQEVALVFSDTKAADNYTKLLELEGQIERYTRLANQSDNYIFNVDDLDSYIDESVINLEELITEGKFTLLSDRVNDLRNQVVTRQIATGTNMDFDARLASLQAQYDALKKSNVKHSSVKSSDSGYYIDGTDGYEKTIDCKDIANITVDDIKEALKSKPKNVPTGAIGKVVTEFTWYFVCTANANAVGKLSVGNKVTINLPYSAVNSVEATVFAINESEGDEVALVFACNLMNSDIASLRIESAELVIDSYTGIKIPSSAIRVNEDGEKGVYVKSGNIAKFKKIQVVYTDDEYVLSQADEGATGYVGLYDDIITEGKELYDGKIIK